MKEIFILLVISILSALVFAQDVTNITTTTTTLPALLDPIKDAYAFIVSANPFILLVLGIVLIAASKLAHVIGIILIIFAIVQIVLTYI